MGSMPKRINFQLPADKLAELGEVIKHDKRPEVRQRATAMRLLSRGKRWLRWPRSWR